MRRPIQVGLVVGLLVLLGVVAATTWSIQASQLRHEVAGRLTKAESVMSIETEQETRLLSEVLSVFEADAELGRLWRSGDRDALLEHVRSTFERCRRKLGVTDFYFIGTDRVCALRVHAPERRGDLIERYTLREAVRTGAETSGIELGALGTFTLRVVRPWRVGGELVGYLELGREIEDLVEEIGAREGLEVVLMVDKRRVDRRRWQAGLRLFGKAPLAPWDRFEKHLLIDSTWEELPPDLLEHIARAHDQEQESHGPRATSFGQRSYVIRSSPLSDASGEDVGEMVVALDVTHARQLSRTLLGVILTSFLVAGAVLGGVFWIMLGRTERRLRAADLEVRKSASVLQGIFDGIPNPVLLLDPSYRIVRANLAARALNPALLEAGAPTTCYAFSHRRDSPCEGNCTCPLNEVVRTKGAVTATHVHYDAEGEPRHVDLVAAPVLNEAGEVEFVIETGYDVTDRALVAQELLRARVEADRAAVAAEEASQAKTEFLANMSHELRTPMNGVLGMTHVLLDTPLEEQQREYLEMIRASSNSLLELLNDVLDCSKIEAGQLRLECVAFDLRRVAEEVTDLLVAGLEDRPVEVRLDLAPEIPPRLCGDPARMRQILINLIGNAIKFTERGEVSICLSVIRVEAEQVRVRCAVSDTGIGVSAEKLEALFEPFVQADMSTTRRFGGTGLGLSICRQLLELMGGTLEVESEPDRGSTFWFEVELKIGQEPSCCDPPLARSSDLEPGVDLKGALRGKRVLVVEDNPVNQRVALLLLKRKFGLDADTSPNGLAALVALEQEPYDLILMDCQMPELDGYETTRKIRDPSSRIRDHGIPIVAMTAHAMKGDREKCLAAGMNDYLAKPIKPAGLERVLTAWLLAQE